MTMESKVTEAARKRYNRIAPVYDFMEGLVERSRYSGWRELLWQGRRPHRPLHPPRPRSGDAGEAVGLRAYNRWASTLFNLAVG